MLARIHRPAKTAMQSGRGKAQDWVLEFEAESARKSDPLMGWTSSGDTRGQIVLRFDTREDAIAYAQKHQIPFQVSEPREPKRIPRAYSDNFAFRRREPWSH
jgi:ETC complex I subunit conserved region